MHLLEQVMVTEPDKVGKVGRNEFIGITDLKRQLQSRRRVRVGVGDIVEGSTFAQLPRGFLEIFIANDRARRQSARGRDFFRRKALAAGYFYLKKLVCRGRSWMRGLVFRGLRLSVNCWASDISKREEKEQGSRQQLRPNAGEPFLHRIVPRYLMPSLAEL